MPLISFSRAEARSSAYPTTHALHEPGLRFTLCGKLAAGWSLPREGEPTCAGCRRSLRAIVEGRSNSRLAEGGE